MSHFDPLRFVLLYLAILGAGLLIDGGLQFVVNGDSNVTQDALHAAWGIALLVTCSLARKGHTMRAVWAALISGAFSVALGILGLTIGRPLGMAFGTGDTFFYLSQGLVSLAIGAWCLRLISAPVAPLRIAAHPAGSRNGPVVRRRPHRRRGPGRGGTRRR